MTEQSHRDEMNAAIRAQRERQAAPRTMVSTEDVRPPELVEEQATPPAPKDEPPPRRGLLGRLRGR